MKKIELLKALKDGQVARLMFFKNSYPATTVIGICNFNGIMMPYLAPGVVEERSNSFTFLPPQFTTLLNILESWGTCDEYDLRDPGELTWQLPKTESVLKFRRKCLRKGTEALAAKRRKIENHLRTHHEAIEPTYQMLGLA